MLHCVFLRNSTHQINKSRPIPLDAATRNNLSNFKTDLVGAEIFLPNSSFLLILCSFYIPRYNNITYNLWFILFSSDRSTSLLGGDSNAFHPTRLPLLISHHGNSIYNNVGTLGLCFLNDNSPTHIGFGIFWFGHWFIFLLIRSYLETILVHSRRFTY